MILRTPTFASSIPQEAQIRSEGQQRQARARKHPRRELTGTRLCLSRLSPAPQEQAPAPGTSSLGWTPRVRRTGPGSQHQNRRRSCLQPSSYACVSSGRGRVDFSVFHTSDQTQSQRSGDTSTVQLGALTKLKPTHAARAGRSECRGRRGPIHATGVLSRDDYTPGFQAPLSPSPPPN